MHDNGDEHWHADGDPEALEQDHPLWRADRVVLRSVGIDIGSSTSHLIFSTLELRRQGAVLSSRFEIAGRRVDHASPILLTPFRAGAALDVEQLSGFIGSVYRGAGIAPEEIDTGAVITTGDAARKDNAEAVVQLLAGEAGKFVCASAGPLLEAKMAAYGSGAVARSMLAGREATVLNIDIGGGTSKLAIARDGRLLDVTAINVGARLVTFDPADVLTKIERAADVVSQHGRFGLAVGSTIREKTRLDLAAALVDALFEVAARQPLSDLTRELMIAAPFSYRGPIDLVIFSGGVSEYFYHRQVPAFGDIGPQIARLLRQRLPKALPGVALEEPAHGIRATVIGASQFTAQVSGNTIHIGNPDLLPLRNLQVVTVDLAAVTMAAVTAAAIAEEVQRRLAAIEYGGDRPVALAVRWPHGPAFRQLDALAIGVAEALRSARLQRQPIVLVIDVDIARLIGTLLVQRADGYRDILCIDGIDLQEFDYIDIGQVQPDSGVVTVVVKSLVFTG